MNRRTLVLLSLALLACGAALPAAAEDIVVTMQKTTRDGPGADIGTVIIASGTAGTTFQVNLHDLPPGVHGFHVHQNDDCGPILLNGVRIPAGAAGGHWDPGETGRHAGPDGDGHLGDLPVLTVAADGSAIETLTAKRITKPDALKRRSLVIAIGGDTYSDSPRVNGGGGGNLACGVIH